MREIKFRAWNDESNMMTDIFDLSDIANTDGTHIVQTDCTIMKFTGLKDKNGKEIYEGDIINSPAGIRDGIPGKVVKWIDKSDSYSSVCCFVMFDKQDNGEGFYNSTFSKFDKGNLFATNVVQGNIYENPELLNDEVQKDGE